MQLRHAKHNLQPAEDTFVGRTRIVRRIHRYFENDSDVVILTGPEGIGKSRTAHRYLSHYLNDWLKAGHSGAFIVDLSFVRTVDEFIFSLQKSLDFDIRFAAQQESVSGSISPNDSPKSTSSEKEFAGKLLEKSEGNYALDEVVSLFQKREKGLLLLDGAQYCEEIVVDFIARLRAEKSPLCFLITTPTTLGIDDEAHLEIPGLRLPARKEATDAVLQSEAIRLFLERTRDVLRAYVPKGKDLDAIANIVRHLEGNPLAIELAAARMRGLSPQELLERLPRQMSSLRKKNQPNQVKNDAREAVEWSWSLLSPREQHLLEQASLFQGGFDETAAEAILKFAQPDDPRLARGSGILCESPSIDVLDILQDLVDKKLLKAKLVEEEGLTIRFSNFPAIQSYARRTLANRKDEGLQRRHQDYFLKLGEELVEKIDGTAGFSARRALERDGDNLLALAQRLLEKEPHDEENIGNAFRAIFILEPILTMRGPFTLYFELLQQVLSAGENLAISPDLWARGFEARGRGFRAQGRWQRCREDMERAVFFAKKTKDPVTQGRALANLGTCDVDDGNFSRAQKRYEEATRLLQKGAAKAVLGRNDIFCALLAARKGDEARAQLLLERALKNLRKYGDKRYEGITLWHLGTLYCRRGNKLSMSTEEGESNEAFGDSRRFLRRSLQIHRSMKNLRFEFETLLSLARVELEERQPTLARNHLERALVVAERGLDAVPQARAALLLCDVHLGLGLFSEATEWGRTARRLARQAHHLEWGAWSTLRLAALASLSDKSSRRERAETSLRSLLQMQDESEEEKKNVPRFLAAFNGPGSAVLALLRGGSLSSRDWVGLSLSGGEQDSLDDAWRFLNALKVSK